MAGFIIARIASCTSVVLKGAISTAAARRIRGMTAYGMQRVANISILKAGTQIDRTSGLDLMTIYMTIYFCYG
jgi:hypothetical protein